MASETRSDLETLVTMIARSPIVVTERCAQRLLPAGFEAVDIAILGWIAEETRRINRRYLPH